MGGVDEDGWALGSFSIQCKGRGSGIAIPIGPLEVIGAHFDLGGRVIDIREIRGRGPGGRDRCPGAVGINRLRRGGAKRKGGDSGTRRAAGAILE